MKRLEEFVFSFLRPKVRSGREFVAQLSKLYTTNHKFARLIGTQVAPAWADGRLVAEVMPQHLPFLEQWLAHFWARNSGMPLEEALLRAKIGQARLKGRRVSPDGRPVRAKKLRDSLAALWAKREGEPEALVLVKKQDKHAHVTRWMRADTTDLAQVEEWAFENVDLPYHVVQPWDLRPEAVSLPTVPALDDLHVEEHYEHVDKALLRSDEEWAHGNPDRDKVRIGEQVIKIDDLPEVARDLYARAALAQDGYALDALDAAMESYEERQARQTWGYVNLSDGLGTVTVRVRTWTETNRRRVGKPIPVLPPEKRKAPERGQAREAPFGPWYHSSIERWEQAAKTDKRLAEALAEFREEQAKEQARRELLNADHDEVHQGLKDTFTLGEILELLTEDRDERIAEGENVPAWLERQIAFYEHAARQAVRRMKRAGIEPEEEILKRLQQECLTDDVNAENDDDDDGSATPAAAMLPTVIRAATADRIQLETELELTRGKARRGLVGELARLRLLEKQAKG